jgi:hypothetical protein
VVAHYASGGNYTSADSAPVTFTISPAQKSTNIGILLLDPCGARALDDAGNGAVTVSGTGGTIVVDSRSATAVVVDGNGKVSAADLDVTGKARTSGGHAAIDAPVDSGVAPTADPLAGLAAPTAGGPTVSKAQYDKGSVTLKPGTYLDGLDLSGTTNVTLLPGIYYLKGDLSVSGQAKVTGSGVLIYCAGGSISLSGQAVVTLTAATSGTYQGIALWQHGQCSTPAFAVTGQASLNITGTLYAPHSQVQVSGKGLLNLQGNAANRIGAHLIAFDLQVTGNGVVTIDTSDNDAAPLPAPVAGSNPEGRPLKCSCPLDQLYSHWPSQSFAALNCIHGPVRTCLDKVVDWSADIAWQLSPFGHR